MYSVVCGVGALAVTITAVLQHRGIPALQVERWEGLHSSGGRWEGLLEWGRWEGLHSMGEVGDP